MSLYVPSFSHQTLGRESIHRNPWILASVVPICFKNSCPQMIVLWSFVPARPTCSMPMVGDRIHVDASTLSGERDLCALEVGAVTAGRSSSSSAEWPPAVNKFQFVLGACTGVRCVGTSEPIPVDLVKRAREREGPVFQVERLTSHHRGR